MRRIIFLVDEMEGFVNLCFYPNLYYLQSNSQTFNRYIPFVDPQINAMNYPSVLKSLNQLSQSISSAHSLDQFLWEVTRTCTPLLELEDLVIYTRPKKEATLVQSAAFGEKCTDQNAILNPLQIPIGKGIVGQSALTQSPQKVDDTSQNRHYLIDDRHRLSELAVPIIWNNKVLGVIDSEHRHKGYFSSIYVDIFGLIAALCAPIMNQLLQQKKKQNTTAGQKYYEQLIHLLEKEKIYRDKHLSLQSVSSQLQITPIYLSNIINQMGEEPFATLVNKYRIREIKTLLHQGQHQQYKLLALAYQVGFNSKSSFNYNFKLQTQITPSQFIKQMAN